MLFSSFDYYIFQYLDCGFTPCNILLVQVMNLIGDVKGKVAVMLDDMIDTAGEPSYLIQ